MKKILYLLVLIPILCQQSCKFVEENLFDASAAERIAQTIKEYNAILNSADNGWLMEYYSKDLGGYTYLCKFQTLDGQARGNVTVASELDLKDYPVGETVSSLYEVIHDQSVILTFNTYNPIFHYFAEPASGRRNGYNGDYEFVFTDVVSENMIVLRGKKLNDRIVMTPFKGSGWKSYLQDIVALEEQCDFGTYQLNIESDSIGSVFMDKRKATFSTPDTTIVQRFMYTPSGIKLYEPVTIKDKQLEYFNWNNTDKVFKSVNPDVNVVIALSLPKGYLFYEDILGSFTMRYSTSNAQPANRNRSLPVTFVQVKKGETFYLKGILSDADEALGNIVVKYNKTRGGIDLLGQILFKRESTNYDFWWLPYSEPVGGSNYINRSTTVGMISSNVVISSGKITIPVKDNGLWSGYPVAGFLLRNYDGSTSMGNINGKDGQAFYFFPLFEKD